MSKWEGKTRGGVAGYKIFIYLIKNLGVKSAYLHSDIQTMERMEIITGTLKTLLMGMWSGVLKNMETKYVYY